MTKHLTQNRILLIGILLYFAAVQTGWATASFDQIQKVVQTRNKDAFLAMISANPDTRAVAQDFIRTYFESPFKKIVLKPSELTEAKMLVQIFAEGEDSALYQSWMIDASDQDGKTLIEGLRLVSSIDGLYRLRLSSQSIPVKNVTITHMDASIQVQSGSLFLLKAGKQLAGAVFIGNAQFGFAPQDSTEKQQISLFYKKEKLQSRIDSFYIRGSSAMLRTLFGETLSQEPVSGNDNLFQKAAGIVQAYSTSAFALSLPLTPELWYPQISGADLFCALKTEAGNLLYQYSPTEAEDVALITHPKGQVISVYRSAHNRVPDAKPESFRMLSTSLKLVFNPGTTHFSTVATLRFAAKTQTSTLLLKLNSGLQVTNINSSQGPLIYFQERDNNNLHVVLNEPLEKDGEMQLEIRYFGKVEPELARNEAASMQAVQEDMEVFVPPSYLYSNQSKWYPDLLSASYSPVETSITVPESYTAISNGILTETEENGAERTYHYRCETPVKYFSLLVADLDSSFSYDSIVPIKVFFFSIDRDTARDYAKSADDILRLYQQWFGPYPYQNLNIVLKPSLEPGGHAPASMAVINRVFSYYHLRFRKDPLDQPDFPTFFLAHELAHQWWGQAVGWRTYRDQWLSEGFAQYAAAEYIRTRYGDAGWQKVTDQFTDWIEEKQDAGPLILGSRLGHLDNDSQAYTTIVYNKGAYVLNMLKLWLGEENFHSCMKEFYLRYRNQESGLREFETIAQKYSEQSLDPFFQQWFYRWSIPEVAYHQQIQAQQSDPSLILRFRQKTADTYVLRIPVEVRGKDGSLFRTVAVVDESEKEVRIPVPFVPQSVKIDPLHENLAKYTPE